MSDRKILIVDDEDHLRELVQFCLEDLAGWNTLCAGSGQEALEILQTESVQAILLDVSMPDMDGPTVYKQIKIDEKIRIFP